MAEQYQDLQCFKCGASKPGHMLICASAERCHRPAAKLRDGYTALCPDHADQLGFANAYADKARFKNQSKASEVSSPIQSKASEVRSPITPQVSHAEAAEHDFETIFEMSPNPREDPSAGKTKLGDVAESERRLQQVLEELSAAQLANQLLEQRIHKEDVFRERAIEAIKAAGQERDTLSEELAAAGQEIRRINNEHKASESEHHEEAQRLCEQLALAEDTAARQRQETLQAHQELAELELVVKASRSQIQQMEEHLENNELESCNAVENSRSEKE